MKFARMLLAVVALSTGVVAHAADDQAEFELHAVGMIDVGPDGTVHDYTLESRLEPQVAELVDRTVRGWTFEPVLVDGRAVIASTRMALRLEAVPRGDGYALRVADVDFGGPWPGENVPPEYPGAALSRGIGAEVSMLLQVAPDGRVTGMHVEQVSLTEKLGKRGNAVREWFADASRKAATHWTFDTGEIVDGEPVAMQIRVPVDFHLPNADGWTKRSTFHPGPYAPAPWARPEDPAPSGTALAQGDIQALDDPRVRLRDDVVGTFL